MLGLKERGEISIKAKYSIKAMGPRNKDGNSIKESVTGSGNKKGAKTVHDQTSIIQSQGQRT